MALFFLYSFCYFLLGNSNSGNSAGQDQEFWMNDKRKWQFKEWYTWYTHPVKYWFLRASHLLVARHFWAFQSWDYRPPQKTYIFSAIYNIQFRNKNRFLKENKILHLYLVRSIPLCWWLLLVSMAVKHNNVLLNLITGCLYWLTTCFGQLHFVA